ncbi:MAG: Ig-like domain-containing protein, partial [Anaerolineales bacterium]
MNKRLLRGLAVFLVLGFTSMLFLPQHAVVAVEQDPPTLVISSTEEDPTNADPIPITFTFSEDVFGFEESDIDVENGTVDLGSLTGSGDEYSVDIIPTDDGEVSVDVPEDVCEDAAANGNLAAETFTITYDGTKPTPAFTSEPNPTNTAPIEVTIDFGEPVGDLLLSEVNVAGTYLDLDLSPLTGPAQVYTLTITPDEDEVFEIQIAADVVEDAAGNPNLASVSFEVEFDTTSPEVEIDSPAFPSTGTSPIPVTITFAEPVTGFFASEIEVN